MKYAKFLLCMYCLFTLQTLQAQCTLQFSGKIRDADTKEVLSNATVTFKLLGTQAITDSTGSFMVKGLCPGHYDISISHAGCETLETHIHITDDYNNHYFLPHAVNSLQGVTVVSTLNKDKNAALISGNAIDASRGLSLAETLKKITGVTVLQTGTNIYKPVIHGLHSSRVLILNNGIRQEGQQWGNEHAPEIDPYIANRLTVIKGANSLRYGGDAIGGIIIIEPNLLPATPGITGEINMAAFTNNKMGVLSAMVEGNLKNLSAFSWRLQGTFKRGGNAKTPGYWLANTGLKEYNFSATAGWRKPNWGTELFYSQFNTQLGIFTGSHIGNVSDLINAIRNTSPPDYIKNAGFTYTIGRPYQEVQHHLLKSKTYFNTGNKGRMNIINALQYNNRKEYDVKRFQSSEDVPQLDLSIATLSNDVIWDHYGNERLRGTIGISNMYQDNQYSRRLFIPNYKAISTGLFVIEKWAYNQWGIESGLRYDYRKLYNTYTNDGKLYADRNYSSFSGNMGVGYKFSNAIHFQLNASSAWRPPNINELYSDGLHHGAARIEKGDSSLLPERANGIMATLTIQSEKYQIEVSPFVKYINHFIFLKPTYPPQLTIRGAFPSFVFDQTQARLSGLDALASYQITHHLKCTGKASLLRAWDKTAKDWIIQMPADRFSYELEYLFNNHNLFKESYLKLHTEQVLKQTRVPATGNIELLQPDGSIKLVADYAPPPPAYFLLNFEAGTKIKTKGNSIHINVTATNLLNRMYRDYMNAFRYYADEMGRNISLKVKIPF